LLNHPVFIVSTTLATQNYTNYYRPHTEKTVFYKL
jgi:hypothetical protein